MEDVAGLAEFVLARNDEREAVARAAGDPAWHTLPHEMYEGRIEDSLGEVVVYDEGSPNAAQAAHIALNDPAHVLAWCETVRRIVKEAAPSIADLQRLSDTEFGVSSDHDESERLLRLLALPDAAHPDYDPAWAV